jgi:hypothetical protein
VTEDDNEVSPLEELGQLCDDFRDALYESLCEAERKHGWDGQWKRDGWRLELIDCLLQNVQEGDPLKVAAYAAFAWRHNWSLKADGADDDRYEDRTPHTLMIADARLMVKNLTEISERLHNRNITMSLNVSATISTTEWENYSVEFTQKL